MAGAIKVQRYRPAQIQDDTIFTHIAGLLDDIVAMSELGLMENKNQILKYCIFMLKPYLHMWDLLKPVGKCHHNVKRRQSKHNVEKRPIISNFFLFIIPERKKNHILKLSNKYLIEYIDTSP